jgi:hypothetical protein
MHLWSNAQCTHIHFLPGSGRKGLSQGVYTYLHNTIPTPTLPQVTSPLDYTALLTILPVPVARDWRLGVLISILPPTSKVQPLFID